MVSLAFLVRRRRPVPRNVEEFQIRMNTFSLIRSVYIGTALFAVLAVSACDSVETEPVNPDEIIIDGQIVDLSKRETVFGTGGLFGNNNAETNTGLGSGIGVNVFLWRATLDTVSVWPISSADPFGGVIITDWYSLPEAPGERFKLNVFILDRVLRADGVRVSLFRQTQNTSGEWQNAEVQKESSRKLEDAILTRARQLRNQSVSR